MKVPNYIGVPSCLKLSCVFRRARDHDHMLVRREYSYRLMRLVRLLKVRLA